MECPVEVFEQFIDVFVGALHRRQSTCVFAREGFGACAEERDERYSRMSARKVAVVSPITSGKFPVGQGSSTSFIRQRSSSGSSR